MPRYYCDYCDTYLTHDSPSVRKQHNAGYKHKANVRTYYQQFEEQQTQSLIDQRIKEHLGSQFQHQVGAPFNHLLGLQQNLQRPRLPVLPPIMMGAPNQAPLIPGMVRPPVLPRPVANIPGYGAPPVPPSMAPPGATSMPMQMNTLPGPPTLNPSAGIATASNPNGAATLNQTVYQANATTAGAVNFNSYSSPAIPGPPPTVSGVPTAPTTASQDSLAYAATSAPSTSSSNISNMP